MSSTTTDQVQSTRTASETFHLCAQEGRKKYKGKGKERATDHATDRETGSSMLEASATPDTTYSDPGPSTQRVMTVDNTPQPHLGPSTPRLIAIADLTLPNPSPLRLPASAIEDTTRHVPQNSVSQGSEMEVYHVQDIASPDPGPSTLQASIVADISLSNAGSSTPPASATNATTYPNPGPSIPVASTTTARPESREFPFPAPIVALIRDAPVIDPPNGPNSYCGSPIGTPTQVLHVLPEDASIWYTMGGVPHRIPISIRDHYECPRITCIADDCWICSPSPPVQFLRHGYIPVTAHMVRSDLYFMLPRPEAIQPPAEPVYGICVDPGCYLCTPEYNDAKLRVASAWDQEEV